MILNIVLILVIIHTLGYMIYGKGRATSLSCGLFGYIGQKDNHTFSWDKFNYLGRDNDERGGDSIGRMVGDDIVKFINSKKAKTTYEDFVINFKNSEESHIALGHTRKASVGGVSENTAQPIVLDIPTGEGKFIMVHNGTIHNWRDLAVKYGVETANKSDSMVLAEIILNNGYDVLTEYVGAAAIIIRDDRTPDTLFVFKGESKNCNRLTEERPLYYYQETEDSMYLSSREEGLYFIGGDVENVFDFDTNTLYEIYEGRIVSQTLYDRSEKSQVVVTTTTYNTSVNTNYARAGYASMYSDYNDYDGTSNKALINTEELVVPNPWSKVVVSRLRYWKYERYKFIKLNGIFHITEEGLVRGNPTYTKYEKTKVYYFYNGVMMKDLKSYNEIKDELGKSKNYKESWGGTATLAAHSSHPVCTTESSYSGEDARWVNEHKVVGFYSGYYQPLFSNIRYKFTNGDLVSKEVLSEIRKGIHCKSKIEDANKVALVDAQSDMESKIDSYIKEEQSSPKQNTISYLAEITSKVATANKEEDNIEEEESVEISNEINTAMSSLLIAIDSSKNDLEVMQIDSPIIRNIIQNLNTIEDILQDDKVFKTKKIEIQYEKH